MRNHDYWMTNSYHYRESVKAANRAEKGSADYRNKYLNLRKMVRELCKEKGITAADLSDNQLKAFGIK